jgi:hypothetical protein
MSWGLRHAIAGAVVVAGAVALTTALYFALLVGAAVAGVPLGGPLVLPFLMLLALVAGVAAVGFVLFPVTALAEWIFTRYRLPWAVQLPLATAFLSAYVVSISPWVAVSRGVPLSAAPVWAGLAFVLLLIPLGIYWWTAQSVLWVAGLGATLWNRRLYRVEPGAELDNQSRLTGLQ